MAIIPTNTYDSLGRLIFTAANSTTECRHYYFDASSGYSGTIPTGISVSNKWGRLVEAATDACAANTLITDEWFSYDQDGRVTTQWQLTPHSSQYYKSITTYYGSGAVNTVQLTSPSLYTMTVGVDGEGRGTTLTDTTASQNLVTGVVYVSGATVLRLFTQRRNRARDCSRHLSLQGR